MRWWRVSRWTSRPHSSQAWASLLPFLLAGEPTGRFYPRQALFYVIVVSSYPRGAYRSCSSRHWILPLALLGRLSAISTRRGVLVGGHPFSGPLDYLFAGDAFAALVEHDHGLDCPRPCARRAPR